MENIFQRTSASLPEPIPGSLTVFDDLDLGTDLGSGTESRGYIDSLSPLSHRQAEQIFDDKKCIYNECDKYLNMVSIGNIVEGIAGLSSIYEDQSKYSKLVKHQQVRLLINLGIDLYSKKEITKSYEYLCRARQNTSFHHFEINDYEKAYCIFLVGRLNKEEDKICEYIYLEKANLYFSLLKPEEQMEVLSTLVKHYSAKAIKSSSFKKDSAVKRAYRYIEKLECFREENADQYFPVEAIKVINVFLMLYYSRIDENDFLCFTYAELLMQTGVPNVPNLCMSLGEIYQRLGSGYDHGFQLSEDIIIHQNPSMALKYYREFIRTQMFNSLSYSEKTYFCVRVAHLYFQEMGLAKGSRLSDISNQALLYYKKFKSYIWDHLGSITFHYYFARAAYNASLASSFRHELMFDVSKIVEENMYLERDYKKASLLCYYGFCHRYSLFGHNGKLFVLENPEQVFESLKEACDIIDDLGIDAMDPKLFSEAFQVLASCYREKGDVEQADYCEQRCWGIWGLVNN